ncbi:hypothetical protein [Lentzea guizhouensis]|uniref:hypothetical protein n=1 Tax=Lentzea guizhouensis TaxID=1586287 RepID=UPI001F392716|nr:hypothetical protein [Lentzea guizhouensis]
MAGFARRCQHAARSWGGGACSAATPRRVAVAASSATSTAQLVQRARWISKAARSVSDTAFTA